MFNDRFTKVALAITSASIALLAIFPSVAQSDVAAVFDIDEGWTTPVEAQTPGSMAALFIDNSHLSRPGVSYLVQNGKNPSNSAIDPTCSSTTDEKCDFTNYQFLATLPICANATDVNCLSEVGAIDASGTKFLGSFSRYLPNKAQNEYTGNPDWNLPSGTGASLFTIPGVDHAAGNNYLVSVSMGGHGRQAGNDKSITLDDFSTSIVPVQLLDVGGLFANTGCFSIPRVCNPGVGRLERPDGSVGWGLTGGTSGAGKYSCAGISWSENLCAQKQAFPTGFRFYFKAKLTLTPNGWLHGRISEPNISVTTAGNVTELSVTATPIKVPIVYKRYQWNEMPAELQNLYNPSNGQNKSGSWSSSQRLLSVADSTNPLLRAMTSSPLPYENKAMPELSAWLKYAEDKATAMPSYWSVRSLSGNELRSANSCFSNPKQINGIVTTNSTQYSGGPPEFNKDEQSLNYKVASPHFTSTGDVFKGSYDLAMRSDVARCVYGFSKAPVRATVSIVSSDGTPQVATTVFNEKDGWVYLSAKNFEYSAPSVRVKLEQDAPAPSETAKPADAPKSVESAKPVVAKKVTITCKKGKTTKKVTALKPVCPAGFKKA
jgi:hypothetical protein